jgi:hypothetical protein
MYRFLLKYRQVIINGAIFTFLLLATMNFHSDFFLGAGLMAFGESVANLKRKRNENEVMKKSLSDN